MVRIRESALASPVASGLAVARCLVGATLVVRPGIAEATDQPQRMLAQTIGIRDVVLGFGTLRALSITGGHDTAWTQLALVSDCADTALAALSFGALGGARGLVALLAPVPFIAGGRYVLRNRLQR